MFQYIKDGSRAEGSGIDKLENLLMTFLDYAREYPNHLNFIGFFDQYYGEIYPNEEIASLYRDEVRDKKNLLMEEYLREGIKDGTIRSEINPKVVSASIYETIISLLQRMTYKGKAIAKEHDIEFEKVVLTVYKMIIEYIKS